MESFLLNVASDEPALSGLEIEILRYMERYPTFSFSSGRLSKVFGISSQKISKILIELSRDGYLERRTRGGIKRPKAFYRCGNRKN